MQLIPLEELSGRHNAGKRCFERLLICRPKYWLAEWEENGHKDWHTGLQFGHLGQEIADYYRDKMHIPVKPAGTFKVPAVL